MHTLHALMTLLAMLMALTATAAGAMPSAAMPDAASACHESATAEDGKPVTDPAEALATMACCVACAAPPLITPPLRGPAGVPSPATTPPTLHLPVGRTPAPVHGPPRV